MLFRKTSGEGGREREEREKEREREGGREGERDYFQIFC